MTTKADILLAIRRKCIDCCVGSLAEVRRCHLTACDLHPFRFGRDPNPAEGVGFARSYGTANDFELEKSLGDGLDDASSKSRQTAVKKEKTK